MEYSFWVILSIFVVFVGVFIYALWKDVLKGVHISKKLLISGVVVLVFVCVFVFGVDYPTLQDNSNIMASESAVMSSEHPDES